MRWLVVAVATVVAACGPTPPATLAPSAAWSPTATPAAVATAAAGAYALPTGSPATFNCSQTQGTMVLRGSPTGPWRTWVDNGYGAEFELAWPDGYTARFDPLLEIVAPGGTVVARDGEPIPIFCEIGPRLAWPQSLLAAGPAPNPSRPQATATPDMALSVGSVAAIPPTDAVWGAAAARVDGAATDGTGGEVVLDAGDGSALATVAKVALGRTASPIALSVGWVAWVESWYGAKQGSALRLAAYAETPGCANFGKPLLWRVMAAARTGGTPVEVASGRSVHSLGGECEPIAVPALALDGDRVAWVAEAGTKSSPDATLVTVRSLATGAAVRTVSDTRFVESVSLDGTAVMLTDWGSDGVGARVFLAADDSRAPAVIPGATDGTVGSGLAAWSSATSGGTVWIAPVADVAAARQVPLPVEPGAVWQGGRAFQSDGGVVAWIEYGTFGDPAQGLGTERLAMWKNGWASARLVAGYAQPDVLLSGGGTLAWDATLDWMDGPTAGWYRVRVDQLP